MLRTVHNVSKTCLLGQFWFVSKIFRWLMNISLMLLPLDLFVLVKSIYVSYFQIIVVNFDIWLGVATNYFVCGTYNFHMNPLWFVFVQDLVIFCVFFCLKSARRCFLYIEGSLATNMHEICSQVLFWGSFRTHERLCSISQQLLLFSGFVFVLLRRWQQIYAWNMQACVNVGEKFSTLKLWALNFYHLILFFDNILKNLSIQHWFLTHIFALNILTAIFLVKRSHLFCIYFTLSLLLFDVKLRVHFWLLLVNWNLFWFKGSHLLLQFLPSLIWPISQLLFV